MHVLFIYPSVKQLLEILDFLNCLPFDFLDVCVLVGFELQKLVLNVSCVLLDVALHFNDPEMQFFFDFFEFFFEVGFFHEFGLMALKLLDYSLVVLLLFEHKHGAFVEHLNFLADDE